MGSKQRSSSLGTGVSGAVDQLTPVKVKGVGGSGELGGSVTGKVVKLRAGGTSAIAITESGAAYGWGDNSYQKLGTLNSGKSIYPLQDGRSEQCV